MWEDPRKGGVLLGLISVQALLPIVLGLLGAMRELGGETSAQHAALAGLVAAAGVAELALVGPEMAALKVDGASYLPDWQAALAWATATLRADDVLLVKGSNSVGLGRLVEQLKADR